jgi:hypothetical protein
LENSPPLSVSICSVSLSIKIFSVVSAAVLLFKSNPNIKLQNVKSKVMITLPPILPMTVSISTHDLILFSSMKLRKSEYVRPSLIDLGTESGLRHLRDLNLGTLGKSNLQTDK